MKYFKPKEKKLLWDRSWEKSPYWRTKNAYSELEYLLQVMSFDTNAICDDDTLIIKLYFDYGYRTDTEVITCIANYGGYNVSITDWLEGNPTVYIEWISPVSFLTKVMEKADYLEEDSNV